jgi:hypothetical protein
MKSYSDLKEALILRAAERRGKQRVETRIRMRYSAVQAVPPAFSTSFHVSESTTHARHKAA